MKSNFLKLSTAIVGAAILSPAFAAGPVSAPRDVFITTRAVQDIYAQKNWTGSSALTVQTWDVNAGGQDFLALCVEPTAPMHTTTQSYTAESNYTFATNGASIARLYGLYYDQIGGAGAEAKKLGLSFQLALWELNNDNGDFASGALAALATGRNATTSTTSVYFGAAPVVQEAYSMLAAAKSEATYANLYTFTRYSSAGLQDFVTAQAVSAVPEPSTHAMLGLGLALVGFAARRGKR